MINIHHRRTNLELFLSCVSLFHWKTRFLRKPDEIVFSKEIQFHWHLLFLGLRGQCFSKCNQRAYIYYQIHYPIYRLRETILLENTKMFVEVRHGVRNFWKFSSYCWSFQVPVGPMRVYQYQIGFYEMLHSWRMAAFIICSTICCYQYTQGKLHNCTWSEFIIC